MIERFRLVETNWSRSFGPEASGLEFQHWNLTIRAFVAISYKQTAVLSIDPFRLYDFASPVRFARADLKTYFLAKPQSRSFGTNIVDQIRAFVAKS